MFDGDEVFTKYPDIPRDIYAFMNVQHQQIVQQVGENSMIQVITWDVDGKKLIDISYALSPHMAYIFQDFKLVMKIVNMRVSQVRDDFRFDSGSMAEFETMRIAALGYYRRDDGTCCNIEMNPDIVPAKYREIYARVSSLHMAWRMERIGKLYESS